MTSEVLARCLEPRFTTDSKTGGTGMGLSLVKAFVDHAGGELRVFSPARLNGSPGGSPGRGTSVVMRFDVSPKQPAHADRQHVRREPAATQPASS
jgi:signal transduction histidine kinase